MVAGEPGCEACWFCAPQKEDQDSSTDLGYMTSEKAYRIVLAGDAAVGKSSFLLRLCKNEFKVTSSATLGESQTGSDHQTTDLH